MFVCRIKLKIADIIIEIKSKFPLEPFTKEETALVNLKVVDKFIYSGKSRCDISIVVNVVDKFPSINKHEMSFKVIHPDSNQENWRLLKTDSHYIYKVPPDPKEFFDSMQQSTFINKRFDKVVVNLLPIPEKGYVWDKRAVFYELLQIILMGYFAHRKKGIFVHSLGLRENNGDGLIFAGRTTAGKSTMAEFWHKHSRAEVLNDDRVIVTKEKNKFIIHSSYWHGGFREYLSKRKSSAELKKIFIISHSKRNKVKKIAKKDVFSMFYPVIFPLFWDKEKLNNVIGFCEDIIKQIDCYDLGFKKNKDIIKFIRKIK